MHFLGETLKSAGLFCSGLLKQPQMADTRFLILETLHEKNRLKQLIYANTISGFDLLRQAMEKVFNDFKPEVESWTEPTARWKLQDVNAHEFSLTFGSDVMILNHHSNVFQFERSHPQWQTSYLKADEQRSYFGVIHVYNFLHDSLAYNRQEDYGYLIARIFINKDNHFMVEGKRQLGFLYNRFSEDAISLEAFEKVLHTCLLYSLDFDLLLPQYDQVKLATVEQVKAYTKLAMGRTGKRLGFRFEADNDGHLW